MHAEASELPKISIENNRFLRSGKDNCSRHGKRGEPQKEKQRLERLQKERERVRTAIMDCLAEKKQTGEKPTCKEIASKLQEAYPKLKYLGVLHLLLELVSEGKVVKEITQDEQVRYCVT